MTRDLPGNITRRPWTNSPGSKVLIGTPFCTTLFRAKPCRDKPISVERFLALFEIVLPWEVAPDSPERASVALDQAHYCKISAVARVWRDAEARADLCGPYAEQFATAFLMNLLGHLTELWKPSPALEEGQEIEPAYKLFGESYLRVLGQIYMVIGDDTPLFELLYGVPFIKGLFSLLYSPNQQEMEHISRILKMATHYLIHSERGHEFKVRTVGGLIESGIYYFRRSENSVTLRPIAILIDMAQM
ncbi:hypothetical protein PSACC_01860 [Paramicrosporidium saccamoebae]|uniref:Uncharacterized protein n=1 Tax=Paramicrosporidium saccamoebae TaxID=1246581 RepID=A0A2H9TKP3_9FUNG|nr:hypothetical protein PSACC_01860 [Paramicrosporidium saccamoebae]